MSPKMKEALVDITAAGNQGAYRKNWHGATVAALLRSGAIETVPGDDTMVRVPKASTESAGVTADVLISQQKALDTTPPILNACGDCTRTLTWIHGMWIGLNGDEYCPNGLSLHKPMRDVDQDAADAEQERTGVHAACGLKIDDHCGRCDVCPIPSEDCGCDTLIDDDDDDELTVITIDPYAGPSLITLTPVPTADDVARMADPVQWVNDTLALENLRLDKEQSFIPATERRALASMLIGSPGMYRVTGHGDRAYDLVSEGDGVTVVRPVAGGMEWAHDSDQVYRVTGDQEMITDVGVARWQLQRARYALRVAGGVGAPGTQAHGAAYAATLERGYPKHKPSKISRRRWR